MSDEPLRDLEGYQLQTGLFRLGQPPGRRWLVGGGWEEDDAIGFHVTVFHPEDPERVKLYAVRIPMTVDRHDLVVEEAEMREL